MRRIVVCCPLAVLSLLFATQPAIAADIVLYASDAVNLNGHWSRTSDSTAAGGQRMASSDTGFSATDGPSASPANYFEFTFTAPADTAHHVWVRLRAGSNSKFNDSVYAQFSDSVNSSGSAIHRIGTANGLTLNLQSCNGCALSGWGWLDGAYWLTQTTTIRFASSGTHTLRIQTREDGVSLDQVVLSPDTYLTGAPGQMIDDSTLVSKPSGGTGTSTPFFGSPAAIPGKIMAQDFDNGGEGVAYHDTTGGNSGGAYRQTGVDLESSTDGGNDVGWISAGEWLKYTVNVTASGSYVVSYRVASSGQGGTFHLEIDGVNVSGTSTIPDTGSWQSWTSLTKTVNLNAGPHVARLVMDTAGPGGSVGNITSMTFASGGAAAPGGSGGLAYGGVAAAVPGVVEASRFDIGGEGVSYHDATAGNEGGAFRSTDVDLETSSDGGVNVGWISAGEWLNYTVNVAASGSYTAQIRVASPNGASFHIGFNSPSSVWSVATVPATGAWQAWTTVNVPVNLNAGTQQITLFFDTSGLNVRSITVVTGSTSPTTPSTPSAPSSGNTVTVPAGGDLQAAINSAKPGDTILLVPGVTYRGIFNLPMKSGSGYVTIRSAASDSLLPGDGVRMTPQYASQLPKVQGGVAGAPAITTSAGAHHYRLQFLEISSTYVENQIVQLGDDGTTQRSLDVVPHDLIIDRCYIHGSATNGQKRGIALNSAATWIVNSYISDIKSGNEDTQAIASWNGPGPYTIENNYLEAAGENILFGGGDPAITDLVPSDISIRFNQIAKQPSWRGQSWTVKNLLELKNAQRVLVDSNVFEYCWAADQQGFAVQLTPRNQDGTATWAVVQNVTFTNNIFRHVASGFSILGLDVSTYRVTNAITIRNNLFVDVNRANWGGSAITLLTLGGEDVTFDHNTIFSDGGSVLYADVATVTGFVFTNNIMPDNAWAVMGGNASEGSGTLAAYFPGSTFKANVIIAANGGAYPSGNYFPIDANGVGFVNLAGGDYRLSASSPYKGRGTDNLDIGCDVTQLRQ